MFNDNAIKVQLADFGFRLGERFLYEYDFYDAWEHDVRLEKVLPLSSQRLLPLCTGGQRLAPPEDCGGARFYMEEGDPRWGAWWDKLPRQEFALMAETVQRILNSDGDRPLIPDREILLAALERVKAHRAACPDRIDRRVINQRLRQYARGERDWLFCDTIG